MPLRRRQLSVAMLRSAGMITLAWALATSLPGSADARTHYRSALRPAPKPVETANKEPFGGVPKGPVQIVISIDQQTLHLYSDGTHVTDTLVATGVPGHPTPMGLFSVIQKSLLHHSNIYSGAPMPFMQRITWSGVAMHEGVNLGHPASHGCIRMGREFAMRLYAFTKVGARVVIARPELKPTEFADPHLLAHVEKPADNPAAPAPEAAAPVKTAQTDGSNKTTDAPDGEPGREKVAAATPANGAGSAPDANGEAGTKGDFAGIAKKETPDPAAAKPAGAQGDGSAPPAAAETAKPTDAAPQQATIAPAAVTPPAVPLPPPKPTEIAHAGKSPISIFISRKEKKLFVRQDLAPLFSVPITIDQPDARIGTHVFTALDYLPDHSHFRWNVISLPGDQPAASPPTVMRTTKPVAAAKVAADPPPPPPPETPAQALARVNIPQEVIDRLSPLMIPGSSIIISDQGLGGETGEGTDFIVVQQGERLAANIPSRPVHRRSSYYYPVWR
jgi:hypothetical protein